MDNKKLNVLMAIDSYFPIVDGVTQTMHNYLCELNKKHNAIALAPLIDKNYKDDFDYKLLRSKSIYLPIYKNRYSIPNFDNKLKKNLKSQPLDIIHIHSPFAVCKFATKLAKKKHIPIVATFHTKFRQEFLARLKFKWLTELFMRKIGKTLSRVDEVFVANESIVEELYSYGYKGKISIMPLGTSWAKNSGSNECSELANIKYNIKKDEIVFLYVGRVEKVKNILFSLQALSELKKTYSNFKFLIVGTGKEESNLKAFVAENNLSDNVIFTGFVTKQDLENIYSRSDLLLFPSSFDTFGLVKIEASAFNTPTLAIKNTCVSYGMIDCKNGFLIENNLESYVNKLVYIMNHKGELKQIGENASKDLYCSWEEATDKLLEKYNQLINENK